MACTGSSPNLTAPTWADVAACHSAASNGDTITVTPGSYTIGTDQITTITKFIRLVGTGVTVTDNVCPGGDCNSPIVITESTAGSTRMSGFTFIKGTGYEAGTHGLIEVFNAVGGKPVILTGITYDMTATGGTGVMFQIHTNRGVISGCTILASVAQVPNCVSSAAFIIHKWSQSAYSAWGTPLVYGMNDTNGDQALYIEDNTVHLSGIDFDDNARAVVRHNTFTNGGATGHGVDTGGWAGPRFADIYNNTHINDQSMQGGVCGQPHRFNGFVGFRGGTFLFHGNVLPVGGTGFWWGTITPIYVAYYTLKRSQGIYPCWNKVTAPGAGYPAPHLPGWGFTVGSITPGASVGAPTEGPQDLEPVYLFNNTGGGNYDNIAVSQYDDEPTNPDSCVHDYPALAPFDDIAGYVQENREFYNQKTSFTGASGTGTGLRSARPSTCTTGVAYWSSDLGVLDKCTATNTWTNAWYTPYTYPHPLVGEAGLSPTDNVGLTDSATLAVTGTAPLGGITLVDVANTNLRSYIKVTG